MVSRYRIGRVAIDAVLIAAAWVGAFLLRFDGDIPPVFETYMRNSLPIVVGVNVAVLLVTGVYHKWWRYISLRDMQAIGRSVVLGSLASWAVLWVLPPVADRRLPFGVAAASLLLTLVFLGGVRVLARSIIERPRPGSFVPRGQEVLIVGAGDAGGLVVREMLTTRMSGYTPIGLVDDDPRKRNMRAARRARARHQRRPAAHPARAPPRRGAPGDPVGRGRRAQPHRHDLPPGGRARQDAAVRRRSRGRRPRPRRASCARCGSRTCSAARPCSSTRARSAPTAATASCS